MQFSKFVAISVVAALLQTSLFAQAPSAAGSSASSGLKLTVVQGQNEKNNIKLKLATIPIVEVRDDRDRLVPGVRIAFVLPNFGPSGKFADGSGSLLVWTDSQGRAAADGLVPNTTEGKFTIRVTATYSGKEASTTITMENTATAGPQKAPIPAGVTQKKSNKLIYILAGVGGAAAAGIFAAKGGSKTTGPPPPTPTSVSVGAVTVGGPR